MKKIYLIIQLTALFLSASLFAQETERKMHSGAADTFTEIDKKNSYVDNISSQNIVSLPIGIKSKIAGDNTTYTIGVTKAKFYPDYTELTVFAKIDIPQKGENGLPMSLFFGAQGIKLSHDGGIIGDAKLALLGDVNIPINDNSWQVSLFGGFNKQTGEVEDLTYVTIDCDGFKEMRISGAVEFSRNLILPVRNGQVSEFDAKIPVTLSNGRQTTAPDRVRGLFDLTAAGWNDILVKVSLDPFVLAKKQNGVDYNGNFQFLVNNAVLDLSDVRNSPAVTFPPVYHQKGLLFPNQETWKGVFVETLNVALPIEFKTNATAQNDSRIYLGASKLLIDRFGVSGTFYADNVFPIEEGITDKQNAWAYSLDHISVTVETNRLIKANFKGEIILPVTKIKKSNSEQTHYGFMYDGIISDDQYSLTVSTSNKINFDIWKAKATLLENSSVQLKVKDGHFLPKATLHGFIDFAASKSSKDEDEGELPEDKKTVDFKGVTFENLTLQTVSPMIQIGSMGYHDNIKFGNFPVSIRNIEIIAQDNRADLYFDMELNLMDKGELKADARLGIKGALEAQGSRQRWKYSGLDLSTIMIDAQFSGLRMTGKLDLLEDHPIYGKGFNAELNVGIKEVFDVKAKAIFGKKDFRYWYFDASAKVTKGGYFINGFGGGAYYKMKRLAFAAPAEFSPSGLTYEPYEDTGLGLKALVSFVIGKNEVFNGEAAFELQFNQHGGLDYAAIYGKGQVMKGIPGLEDIQNLVKKVNYGLESSDSFLKLKDKANENSSFEKRFLPIAEVVIPDLPEDKRATIEFTAAIQLDITNRTTHGTLDVHINAGFISGVGEGGRAGWAVFHKDPKDWYLYIGTPDDRIGIKLGVAGISLKTGSYLMTGTHLPGSPPPPSHVANILGVDADKLKYMRDENELANAGGFAFGSDLSIDTGDLTFLIFYANFKAGVGFDIMLRNYGEAECINTGDQVGIDGWYANGQAYAYLQGELGVKVKLLFVRMKIPIISAGAAVLMQTKLPNPFWMRGYVGGYMNVLGGLIKGKFNFKITIGKQCEFANGGALDGMKIIVDVSPKDQSNDIDVFAVPQATFSMKVNQPIELPNDKGDVETYKIVLERFDVLNEAGQPVEGTLEWTTLKDRANFVSTDILEPNKSFKVQVEVSFQKLENGVFRAITENGQLVKEYEERTFTTGSAPDNIPWNNIEYAYPVVEQKYYFKDEYENGYVKLKRGQDYLFEDNKWKTAVKIQDVEKNKEYNTAFSYNAVSNELRYKMPDIKTSSGYKMIVFSTMKEGASRTEETSNDQISHTEEGNDFTIENKQAENVVRDGEIERLSYTFKTSKYKKFNDKISAINVSNYNFIIHSADVISLANNLKETEPFEEADLVGNDYTAGKSLIVVEASLNDEYFTQDINPILYGKLPIGNKYTITNREVEEYGLIPKRALSINNYYLNSVQNEVNYGNISTYFPYEYDLSLWYKTDLIDIRNQIVNDLASGVITSAHPAYLFLNNNFRSIRNGTYNVIMKYILPGAKQTSETSQIYKNKNN
ncbi:MAG: hypothetical protein LBP34_00265 [Flavobacteriaceae bacterium]|nr:hypothetical protein [Flavobacteriaceae bacterium]